MSQGIAVRMGKHVDMDEANADEPHRPVSEDVAQGVGFCLRHASAPLDSLSAETAWDRLVRIQTINHSFSQQSTTAAQSGLPSPAQTGQHSTS